MNFNLENLLTAVISVVFSAGIAYGVFKTKINNLQFRVSYLEKTVNPVMESLARIEIRLTHIEKDMDAVKKKLNIL